jgi:excisionase family DNA binding protein
MKATQNAANNLISLQQASQLCDLSADHLRRLAEQGKLHSRKIGRNWVTTNEAVEEYLQNRRPPGRPKKLD